jgi:iron complex transport system substrate-binding protein
MTMRNHRLFGTVRVLACAMLVLVTPAHAEEKSSVDVSRIVSIGGDVTEILYALGYEPNIVAVDTTSVYPADALAEKKNVGYMRALSTEGVLSLTPTVIMAADDAGPPEVVAALKSSTVAYVTISGADNPAGTAERIRAVAASVGAAGQGEQLVASVQQKYASLAEKRATIGKPARVLFLLSVQSGRATAGGTGTAAHEVIELAGGTNVATAFSGYKPLSDEASIGLAPDVILVMKRSQRPGQPSSEPIEKIIGAMPGLNATPAARNGRIIEVDGAALLQFGPRTADAALELMRILHPNKQAAKGGQ